MEKIDIIYKSKDYLVINKPAGLLVHPTANKPEAESLVTWLSKKFPKIKTVGEDPLRPGIVHRLDKEVSGLMIIALNQDSFYYFKQQFQDRLINKYYIALVHGQLEQAFGEINFPIKRSNKGFKMAAVPGNYSQEDLTRQALTKYELIQQYHHFALIKVKIETGRTHQIRVHFLAINHPLAGDHLYTNKKSALKNKKLGLQRIFLFANELQFIDNKGEKQNFSVDMPENLQAILKTIK